MPVYEYIALDSSGKEKKGIINAESSKGALQQVRSLGLFPRQIHSVQTKSSGQAKRRRPLLSLRRVSQADLVITMRQLSILLSAGMPLASALDSILRQLKKRSIHRVMAQVRERINEGSSLAQAMEEQGHVFPPTYTAMIEAGESSGTLELVLDRLAEFGEQQQALKQKLQSSLAYPVLILLVSLGVIFFLMSYVVPRVTQIFLDFEQALPLPTLILIKVSNAVHAFWWSLPLLLLALWLGGRRFLATKAGRGWFDTYILRIPTIGPIIHQVLISRFSHTLGNLLHNEVSLLQALHIVRNVVANTQLQKAIDELYQAISEGSSLSGVMARKAIFPPTVVQLVAAGEQSGQLDSMFLKIAQTSEDFVTNRLTMLTSLLEPLMILVLGGVVGFVVLAVLLPIFDMSQLVQ